MMQVYLTFYKPSLVYGYAVQQNTDKQYADRCSCVTVNVGITKFAMQEKCQSYIVGGKRALSLKYMLLTFYALSN